MSFVQTPARRRAQAKTKEMLSKAAAHYIVSGEAFPTLKHIRAILAVRGFDIAETALRSRLRKGADTWEALSRPKGKTGPNPGSEKNIRGAQELQDAIQALNSRKKALKGN